MRKTIFITGASSGVGKSCAEYLLRERHIIFGTSRNADFPRRYSADEINMVPLDLEDSESIERALEFVIESCRRLDVVVNNAGSGFASPVEDAPLEKAKRLMNVNFWGGIEVIQKTIPIFRRQSHGLIINISSLAGRFSLPFHGFYAATKFALEAISESLQMELRKTKIRVVLIEPGDLSTNFTNSRGKIVNEKSYMKAPFLKALEIAERDERNGTNPVEVAKLVAKIINIKNFIGDESKGLQFAKILWDHGIFCPLIRWPAVPVGKSRLRIIVTVNHTEEQFDRFVDICKLAGRQTGII